VRLKGADEAESSNVVDLDGKTVKQNKKRKGYVLLFKGQPVKDVKTALKAACERAGIPYGRNTPMALPSTACGTASALWCSRPNGISGSHSS